ncbi:hypothetical protein EKI60_06145 [Candidatus Saccharibacteria bacterium]|nr:MAG: hypothetical protein EKI60_06145 [Candidatus Saccharibacteria bacterium]
MDTLTSVQVAESIPGSLAPGGTEAQTVKVCGSACIDRDAVALALRQAGVAVQQDGCHGTRGGCSQNGILFEGTYATVPVREETGIVPTEVVVVLAPLTPPRK